MVSKFTSQPTNKEVVNKINDIIDDMGSATGANIDLSNLSSTGEAKFQAPISDLSTIRSRATNGQTAYENMDGEWTIVPSGSIKIVDNVSLNYTTDYSISLASILPTNDLYEVLLTGNVTSGTTNGNFARIYLDSTYNSEVMLCFCRTRSSSSVEAAGSATIQIHRTDSLKMKRASDTNLKGNANLWLLAYKKVR